MEGEQNELEHNLTVPKFFDPIGAFGKYGGVRQFLGNRGKYLITPEEASAIGSYYRNDEHPNDEMPTIYVAIASYRDPECLETLESVFARAKHPQRIRVAIIDQRRRSHEKVPGESDDHSEGKRQGDPSCRPTKSCSKLSGLILCRYIEQIDYMEYPAQLMV